MFGNTRKSMFVLVIGALLLACSFTEARAQSDSQETPTQQTPQLYLPAVASTTSNDALDVETADFRHSWFVTCVNVGNGERGLWDDMPGVAVVGNDGRSDNNEAGLFWLVATNDEDEHCSYYSNMAGVNTSDNRHLRARVAVSDGARFKIEAFEAVGGGACTNLLASAITAANQDNSVFRNLEIVLPPSHVVCRVQITLDDDANNFDGRAKAMINYIWLWDGVAPHERGWYESF